MANSNDELKETKQLKLNPKIENTEQQKNSTPYTRQCNLIITGFAFVFSILALCVTVYTIQHNLQLQKKMAADSNYFNTQIAELKHNQNKNKEKSTIKIDAIQQNQNELQNRLTNLIEQTQAAINQRPYQKQDWLMLKARYYLELEQINVHWSDDFSSSIELLQQADNLLKQLNEPKIFDVRQAIAKDIAQLQSIPTLDIAGLLSQLDAAQISVGNLTIQSNIGESKTEKKNETTKTLNPTAWRSRLQDSLNLLEKLVIVRRNDENIKPLMSPLFESLLRESIQLNLQEAQWAILNKNPVVYQLALKQAITNLKRAFKDETQDTGALIKQLKKLQQIKLNQEKPVIGLALPLLNQVISTQEPTVKQIKSNMKGDNQ